MTVQAAVAPAPGSAGGLEIVPATAPFSEDQRAWLNGFLAAALGAVATAEPPSGMFEAKADVPTGPPLATNDDAPWHDPSLPPTDRMVLAKDRPLPSRLMAAMAQQDCGQCGYTCAAYANAVFLREEKRLNLCAPGGKDTFRLVKALAAELPGEETAAQRSAENAAIPASPAGEPRRGTREAPIAAVFLSRRRLNGEASEKNTQHVEVDLADSGMTYEVGDSLGIFPRNHPGHVDLIIALLGASPGTPIRGRTLREVLIDEVSLGLAPDALFELLSYVLGGGEREKARALARGGDPDGDAAVIDVLAALHKFPRARPHAEAFVDALAPLQPRLYSIASSPRMSPGKVALTVDVVRYVVGKRERQGVASTYLGERVQAGERVRAYVQKAHAFALPMDPATPIIMIGPGTGVAPFRAFLEERKAMGATGKNWLFFGHQRQATDFFYRDEFRAMNRAGLLTRLSLAWSRDGDRKYYVQDRMREVGADVWQWLAEGASIYVCGDAKRMAKDVEAALVEIVAVHGAKSAGDAAGFIASLKRSARYQMDVY